MGLREDILNGATRQTVIKFPGTDKEDITSGFYSGSIYLNEIICDSNNLKFGCSANMFEATIEDITDISGCEIQVNQNIVDYVVPFFHGWVYSSEVSANKKYRNVVAYDAIYKFRNINVADWYNDFFEISTNPTIKTFRYSLCNYIGITQVAISLINDYISIEKTLESDTITFGYLINAICEINGCFGNINRNGQLEYIYLSTNTYEDVSDNLRSSTTTYEEYTTHVIDKVQICQENDDIGGISGTGTNAYVIKANPFAFGMDSEVLGIMATNVYNAISGITYIPSCIDFIVSEPYIPIGSKLTFTCDSNLVSTYMLHNVLSGTQTIRQKSESKGNEIRDGVVDDVNTEINQLKAKTLKITKTVDNFGIELTKKCDTNEIVTAINGSEEGLELIGNRVTIQSDKFNLIEDGTVECTDMKIRGGNIEITNEYAEEEHPYLMLMEEKEELPAGAINPYLYNFGFAASNRSEKFYAKMNGIEYQYVNRDINKTEFHEEADGLVIGSPSYDSVYGKGGISVEISKPSICSTYRFTANSNGVAFESSEFGVNRKCVINKNGNVDSTGQINGQPIELTNTVAGVPITVKIKDGVMRVRMKGTTTSAIDISASYITIIGGLADYLQDTFKADNSTLIKEVIYNGRTYGQLQLQTGGNVLIGYSKKISDGTAYAIPKGTLLLIDEVIPLF